MIPFKSSYVKVPSDIKRKFNASIIIGIPTLIEVLENNSFIISQTETDVTVKDSKTLLTYSTYKAEMLKSLNKTNKMMHNCTDLNHILVYYKCIKKCASEHPRLYNILSEMKIEI